MDGGGGVVGVAVLPGHVCAVDLGGAGDGRGGGKGGGCGGEMCQGWIVVGGLVGMCFPCCWVRFGGSVCGGLMIDMCVFHRP